MAYQFARGSWAACLLAGPVFAATLLFTAVFESPAAAVSIDIQWSEVVGGILVMATPLILIGGLLAFFPVWLGSNALAWASEHNIGLRHPAIWAIVGGAIPAMPIALLDADATSPFGTALIATGAICALIVRYRTRWSDESV